MSKITFLIVAILVIACTSALRINVDRHHTYGNILVDQHGKSIYIFELDTQQGRSTCYYGCSKKWLPVILRTGDKLIAGKGVDSSMLAVTLRSDGTRQVMYANWPLYTLSYEGRDMYNGQGQIDNGKWFLITDQGFPNQMTGQAHNHKLSLKKLHNYISGPMQMAVYVFSSDYFSVSNCINDCLDAFQPLYVKRNEIPHFTSDFQQALFGQTKHQNGKFIATYNGWPLYFSKKEMGHSHKQQATFQFGGYWFVLSPESGFWLDKIIH